MKEYQANAGLSSCKQYQAILAPHRQLDVWGNEHPVYAPIDDIEQKIVRCVSADGQMQLEFTAKQYSLFPSGVRKCLKAKLTFSRTDKSGTSYFRAQCGTWRCPFCRRWLASVDFARIKAALDKENPEDLVFVVATLDGNGIREASPDFNSKKSYAYISQASKMLLQSLRREFGKIKYIATVEQQQNGYAHINYVFSCKEIADLVRHKRVNGYINHPALREFFYRAGFGRFSVEMVRSKDAVAGYVVKIAFEKKLTGEVTKTTQLPINAPLGHRRIRSSQKFLPQVHKREAEEGVTYKFMSGVDAHELTEAQKAWDRHFKEYDLEDSPQEPTDIEAKAKLECEAPMPKALPERASGEIAVVVNLHSALSVSRTSESTSDFSEADAPESEVPIGIGAEIVWFNTARRSKRKLVS